jgi:serine phosphatase RsbU (regulator of sigma subunit)
LDNDRHSAVNNRRHAVGGDKAAQGGELFGNERLREALRAQAGTPASALVPSLIETLQGFGRQREPHDDLTLLAATRL